MGSTLQLGDDCCAHGPRMVHRLLLQIVLLAAPATPLSESAVHVRGYRLFGQRNNRERGRHYAGDGCCGSLDITGRHASSYHRRRPLLGDIHS